MKSRKNYFSDRSTRGFRVDRSREIQRKSFFAFGKKELKGIVKGTSFQGYMEMKPLKL